MGHSPILTPAQLSRRHWVFRLTVAVAVMVCLELLSTLGLRLALGGAVSDLRESRARVEAGGQGSLGGHELAQMTTGLVLHPYVGYVMDPAGQGPDFERFSHNPVSEYGFVDSGAPILHRSRDRAIVGITGGSVAYWFSVFGEAKLREELRRSPAIGNRPIAIVRLALGGYKQPQQLMSLMYVLALGGQFDVIINLDGFNDVAIYPVELAPSRVFLAYPRGWHTRIQSNPTADARLLAGRLAVYAAIRQRWAAGWTVAGLDRLATWNALWLLGDRVLAESQARSNVALGTLRQSGLSYEAQGPPVPLVPSETYRSLAELWAQSSLQMARVCRANGIAYYHFLQPNQYVANSKPMSREERAVAIAPGDLYRVGAELGYPSLISAGSELARQGVAYRDLTGLFKDTGEALYIDSCCHLNQRGNDLLAAAIGDTIARAPTN
jgi:hypothetical protein